MDLSALNEAWNKLRNTPTYTDESGCELLSEPFNCFEPGTDVIEVWHWLEGQHSSFSVAVAMGVA